MIRVTNIQRMCFDDGPGIRTTVFLKGCSLHCPWCSNPENICFEKQAYSLDDVSGELCGCYGIDYTYGELFEVIKKDYKFWGNDGGVTFSGGEALLQAKELEPLLECLKKDNISVGVETALFIPKPLLGIAVKYIDFYYIDVKILDKEVCKKVLGGDVTVFFDNVSWLSKHTDNIVFRVPCSREYVLEDENRSLLCGFFSKYKKFPVEIFSIHNLGEKKYQALKMPIPSIEPVSESELSSFQNELGKCGSRAVIIRI